MGNIAISMSPKNLIGSDQRQNNLSVSFHRSSDSGSRLRLFGDDFAVLPDVDRRAVHARGLARDLAGAAQRTADGGGEFFCFLFHLT